MRIIITGSDAFVRACINSNDILLQMESSDFIRDYWKPFTPIQGNNKINGMVRRSENGTIIIKD